MGMFDRVWIDCPHCGKEIEEQTKEDKCILADYKLDEAPVGLQLAVSDYPIDCYECDESFMVKTQVISQSKVIKL